MGKPKKAPARKQARRLSADEKVRTFPRPYVQPFAPFAPIIHHCERLLQDAKSGKLRALAYATIYHDDLSPAGSVDHGYCTSPGTYYALSHGIRRLVHAWDGECDRDTLEPAISPPPKGPA